MTRPMEDRETPTVQLIGKDGNAFAVMGAVRVAMREANWTKEGITEVTNDMMNGDYDHMLRVVMATCEVK